MEDFAEGEQTTDKFDFDQTYVRVVNDFAEALQYIKKEYGTFDTVLLDINLELGDMDEPEVKEIMSEFIHKKHFEVLMKDRSRLKDNAGFYVYLYLMNKGFPRDRVCFLTGYKYVNPETSFAELRRLMEECNIHTTDTALEKDLYEKVEAFMYKEDFADIAFDFMSLIELGETTKAYELLAETESRVGNLAQATGNYEDIYGKWEEDFARTGIQAPIGFNKGVKEEFNKFNQWFQKRQQKSPYYFLRYGLVQACEFLFERMDSDSSFLRFEDAFYLPKSQKEGNGEEKEQNYLYSDQYFKELLITLKEMLPLYEPSAEVKRSLYKQIIRFISHDWEAVVSVNKFSRVFEEEEQGYKDRTYFYIMKLLRNWSAHNKMVDFTEEEVAFYLLIAFRSYFRLNDRKESAAIQDYEYILLQTIKVLDKAEWPISYQELKRKFKEGEIKLNEQFNQLRTRMEAHYKEQRKEYYSMSVNLYDVLKDMGNELPECKTHDLAIMLWYGMCKVFFGQHGPNIINVTYNYSQISRLINRKENDLFTQLYIRTVEQIC